MAYGITDEIFALSAVYPGELPPAYTYGLITAAVPGWTFGTLLGAVAGRILPDRIVSALGIAIYGMFIAVVVPEAKKQKNVLIGVIITMIASSLLVYCPGLNRVPSEYRIIIVTVAVSALLSLLFPVKDSEDGASDTEEPA